MIQTPITKKSQQGFTLIELLIVVAIIGVIAAIAIPQYTQYRTSAMNSAAQGELKNVQTSLKGYYSSSGNYHYPAGYSGGDWIDNVAVIDFTPSEDVNIYYENIGTNNQTYAVCAWHIHGDQQYAVNSTMSAIDETSCMATGNVDSVGKCNDCDVPRDLP